MSKSRKTNIVVCQDRCVLRTNNAAEAMDYYEHTKKNNPGALVYAMQFVQETPDQYPKPTMLESTQPQQSVPTLNRHYKRPIPQTGNNCNV